jgi:hypothetical protein
MKKGVGSRVRSGSGSLVRGTEPGIRIRIRTKMSRIPNTDKNYLPTYCGGYVVQEKTWMIMKGGR